MKKKILIIAGSVILLTLFGFWAYFAATSVKVDDDSAGFFDHAVVNLHDTKYDNMKFQLSYFGGADYLVPDEAFSPAKTEALQQFYSLAANLETLNLISTHGTVEKKIFAGRYLRLLGEKIDLIRQYGDLAEYHLTQQQTDKAIDVIDRAAQVIALPLRVDGDLEVYPSTSAVLCRMIGETVSRYSLTVPQLKRIDNILTKLQQQLPVTEKQSASAVKMLQCAKIAISAMIYHRENGKFPSDIGILNLGKMETPFKLVCGKVNVRKNYQSAAGRIDRDNIIRVYAGTPPPDDIIIGFDNAQNPAMTILVQ